MESPTDLECCLGRGFNFRLSSSSEFLELKKIKIAVGYVASMPYLQSKQEVASYFSEHKSNFQEGTIHVYYSNELSKNPTFFFQGKWK